MASAGARARRSLIVSVSNVLLYSRFLASAMAGVEKLFVYILCNTKLSGRVSDLREVAMLRTDLGPVKCWSSWRISCSLLGHLQERREGSKILVTAPNKDDVMCWLLTVNHNDDLGGGSLSI